MNNGVAIAADIGMVSHLSGQEAGLGCERQEIPPRYERGRCVANSRGLARGLRGLPTRWRARLLTRGVEGNGGPLALKPRPPVLQKMRDI